MWKARFDLSNTGRIVTVIRYDEWGCNNTDRDFVIGARLPGLAVVDESGESLDPVYNTLNNNIYSYDVIFYKGKTYLTRWQGELSSPPYKLSLYYVDWVPGGMAIYGFPLCTYKFQK